MTTNYDSLRGRMAARYLYNYHDRLRQVLSTMALANAVS